MSDNIQLTLFIPDLLTVSQGRHLPALAALLGRADVTALAELTAEQRLAELFGLAATAQPPVAALTALGDGLAVKTNEWWLRADPVELQADQATAYLMAIEHIDFTKEEVKELLNGLNSLLQQDGLQLIAPHPQRWYLKLADNPGIQSIAPNQLLGKSVQSYLSIGKQQAYWRRLFSELQILLYHHPVNQCRQRQNKPPINGLWFWGEGYLSAPQSTASWKKIWSDSVLAKGLAYWNNITWAAMPAQFAECSWQPGNHLLIFPDLADNAIERWEEQWFQPLLAALKTTQIAELTIYTQQQCFNINRKHMRRWWRRRYKF